MKLGKKLLSCLLAILMITSSVSACFTVFGVGEAQADAIYNAITMDYDGLKAAIDSGDAKRVPTKGSGADWNVTVDTYHSGWYNVATAFAKYAMSVTNNNTNVNTYIDVINKFMAENTGAQNTDPANGPIRSFVQTVLNYFNFDGGSTNMVSTVTLNIGSGFDILAWDTIDQIETDRAYYTTNIRFTPATKGGVGFKALNGESTISINTVKDVDPDGGKNADVKFIKSALEKCVADDAFKKWFALDLNSMSVDEIMTLVQGETSCANVLKVFGDAVALCGYNTTADELWDHYVKDTVGKSYAETQEWVNNGLMEAIYHAYALDYKRQFDEKMAVDYSGFTADET